MLLDYFWWRPVAPSGGHPQYHPWIHGREELAEVEPEVVEAAEVAVREVVEARKIVNPQVDQYLAEQEFRRLLEQQKREWMKEYMGIIAVMYARMEQEDAQIAMLLFDM